MTAQQLADCHIDAEIPELFFYPDMSGYGWVFRKDDYLNIGVGREDSGKISKDALQFLQYLKQQGKIPTNITNGFKGHAYLLYDHAQRTILDDGVLLIGDAAGLAYTESGEGIKPAIESGLLAAEIIINTQGDYPKEMLEPYADKIRQHFGKRQSKQKSWIPDQLRNNLAKLVVTNRFLSRHILLDHYFLRDAVDTPSMLIKQK